MPDALERLKAALADRYVVERELGRGGMTVVFLAEDVKHRRKVALKAFSRTGPQPSEAADLGTATRLLRAPTDASFREVPHTRPARPRPLPRAPAPGRTST